MTSELALAVKEHPRGTGQSRTVRWRFAWGDCAEGLTPEC